MNDGFYALKYVGGAPIGDSKLLERLFSPGNFDGVLNTCPNISCGTAVALLQHPKQSLIILKYSHFILQYYFYT